MSEKNCLILWSFSGLFILYTKEQALEIYHDKYFEEYGSNVPEEFITKFNKCVEEFRNMQKQLRYYYDTREGQNETNDRT